MPSLDWKVLAMKKHSIIGGVLSAFFAFSLMSCELTNRPDEGYIPKACAQLPHSAQPSIHVTHASLPSAKIKIDSQLSGALIDECSTDSELSNFYLADKNPQDTKVFLKMSLPQAGDTLTIYVLEACETDQAPILSKTRVLSAEDIESTEPHCSDAYPTKINLNLNE